MDNDRIMVLEAGEIVEFNEPKKLLENTDGFFTSLVTEAGLDIKKFERVRLTWKNRFCSFLS